VARPAAAGIVLVRRGFARELTGPGSDLMDRVAGSFARVEGLEGADDTGTYATLASPLARAAIERPRRGAGTSSASSSRAFTKASTLPARRVRSSPWRAYGVVLLAAPPGTISTDSFSSIFIMPILALAVAHSAGHARSGSV